MKKEKGSGESGSSSEKGMGRDEATGRQEEKRS